MEREVSNIDLGPQVKDESGFIATMRRHQSWWRAQRLGVSCGVGPSAKGTKLGNYLMPEDGAAGRNFLTDEIHEVASARIGDGVEEYRCRHNLLSSQPMCFNLFGPLVPKTNADLAAQLMNALLPGEVTRVREVRIEHRPEPIADYLGDHTAFDAFIDYERHDGRPAFLGIETKLTEPFSQNNPPERTAHYRQLTAWFDGVWRADRYSELAHPSWYQLWRNHLLVEAVRRHPDSDYASGRVMVVGHPSDANLNKAVDGYAELLVDPPSSMVVRPINQIVAAWKPVVAGTTRGQWLDDFHDRYVDLSLSQGA